MYKMKTKFTFSLKELHKTTQVFNSIGRQFIFCFFFCSSKFDKNLFVKGLCLTLVKHLQGDSLRTWLRQQSTYHLEISFSY